MNTEIISPKWIRMRSDDHFPGARKLFPCPLSSTFAFPGKSCFQHITGSKFFNFTIPNIVSEYHSKQHQASNNVISRFDVHTYEYFELNKKNKLKVLYDTTWGLKIQKRKCHLFPILKYYLNIWAIKFRKDCLGVHKFNKTVKDR